MRSAYDNESSYASAGSPRRRAAALAVSILANLLLVVMLLRLANVGMPAPEAMSRLMTFGVQTEQPSSKKRERSKRPERRSGARAAAKAVPKAAAPATPPVQSAWSDLGIMMLDRRTYAASDIGKITRAPGAVAGKGTGETGAGEDAGTDDGAGAGPHGEKLYNARWYREPTDAELATYVGGRGASPGSWAEVACQTIERFHVDNCQELGDSPPGSGLARAIRQAAWQFLVRPPQVGGKSMVGTWVRIRITFTERGVRTR